MLLGALGDFLAALGVQNLLAEADGLGRDLHQLVLRDVLDGVVQAHVNGRRETNGIVGPVGAEVGELLPFGDVDGEVAGAAVPPDNHPLIHLHAGADEERAALLGIVQRVGRAVAHLQIDQ